MASCVCLQSRAELAFCACLFLPHALSGHMTALAKHHNVSLQAGELAKKRDYGSAKDLNMWKNMEQYRANHEPFEHGLKQGETPEMWWRLVASRLPVEADGSPATITLVARILLSIVPHAAAPEQAFSHMGRTHSDLRNRFKEGTVSMMATINQYFTVQPPAEE